MAVLSITLHSENKCRFYTLYEMLRVSRPVGCAETVVSVGQSQSYLIILEIVGTLGFKYCVSVLLATSK
jgi:hypothetical protein